MRVAVRRAERATKHAIGVLLAQLSTGSGALAQPAAGAPAEAPTLALEWDGPGREEVCLGGERLVEAVEAYLERPAFSPAPAEVTLRVHVEPRAPGWRALLQLIESATGAVLGERELVSDSALCSGLDEPMQLAVALMVDTEVPSARTAGNAAPEPSPPPPEPDAGRAHTGQPSTQDTWHVSVEGALIGEAGALPGMVPGALLGFVASPVGWLSLRAHVAGFLPHVARQGSASAELFLVYAGLELCPMPIREGGLSLGFCAGFNLGSIAADGSSLEAGRKEVSHFIAPSLGARALVDVSRDIALMGFLSAFLPYRPERFVYEIDAERHELFQVASPFFVAGIGASVMF